jgi:hypothetical protein
MLGSWMRNDSKDRPLGTRRSTGDRGLRSQGRNWVHPAATALPFLQAERGLLKPGYKFQSTLPAEVTATGESSTQPA